MWDKLGLLPNTRRPNARHFLYSRADLDRINAAPRDRRGGVDRRAVAAMLAS